MSKQFNSLKLSQKHNLILITATITYNYKQIFYFCVSVPKKKIVLHVNDE